MENASLITGRTIKKNVSVISTSSPVGGQGSSLRIRKPLVLASIYRIVPYNIFTRFPLPLKHSFKHWIVLTGSVRRQTWYIVSFWESEGERIALTGASKNSWIKALICFMRFKRESFESLSDLYKPDERKAAINFKAPEPTKEELATKLVPREERAKTWDAFGAKVVDKNKY